MNTAKYDTSIEDFMNFKRDIDDENLIPIADALEMADICGHMGSLNEGLHMYIRMSTQMQGSPDSVAEDNAKRYCPECISEEDTIDSSYFRHVSLHKSRKAA